MTFPFYRQLNAMDCGQTCLRMIAKHYGKHHNPTNLKKATGLGKEGTSLLSISDAAEKIGFRTLGLKLDHEKLKEIQLPAILHWEQNHFVVLISINKKRARIADPGKGIISYKIADFLKYWLSNKIGDTSLSGTVLMLEPTQAFFEQEEDEEQKLNWTSVIWYLKSYKWQFTQVGISLLISSFLAIILPFLTKSMVDNGISPGNLEYISIVLFAQLMLTFSNTVIGFIRSRLQLRIANSLNISMLSDFWSKITRLPLSYFDNHHTGDTLQRMNDNKQIQSFLTGSSLATIISLMNFAIYSTVLIFYSGTLFLLFMVGNVLYLGWLQLFLRLRRKINYETFRLSAAENNITLQLVQGMQEIRLNNAEILKRWEWENMQSRIFRLNFKNLNYEQWQSMGALFINQGKDIIISFLVARMVVHGSLTFGTMLAIQYIIGQLNAPVQQLIDLTRSIQDAKISMERLNEIHNIEDEEPVNATLATTLPENKSIDIRKLTFTYPSANGDPVLRGIDLKIMQGKVTAIVGMSGSGKTTILKLLLRIYQDYNGLITVGDNDLKYISPSYWRSKCGAVLQDGYIFNDTIARNIAVGTESIDTQRLIESCKVSNILPFIQSLPNGFFSRLGADGIGISQGQKQRILIARAVYKDPEYLLFDEATNALDANNEKAIVEHLSSFFEGRTVLIVAHRLSTVRNADKIIVLDEGQIVEEGTHEELTNIKGHYYKLVENQLELGS